MPAEADLPENRVTWRPCPDRAALLVHDMQNYFVAAYQPDTAPMRDLVRNIAKLTATARELGMPVIYSAQPGGQSDEQRGLLRDF
ncbi:MAG: isochorismatase family protein, partial [Streptosporangiales bacterium]|nr:isochorismatase family protein [Streptosporangiales bacterium]